MTVNKHENLTKSEIVPNINKVFIKQCKIDKFNENEQEWMLDIKGVNLLAVMCHEDVDARRTTNNHLIEVNQVLGIEPARRSLLDELWAIISFHDYYVNYRHLTIMCDTMTRRSHLMAINRHQNNAGTMMRCAVEETMDVLLDAAAFAKLDYMRGPTENIMLGQLTPIGTGVCQYPLALEE